jgi:alcohol dehydrogenase (cytochrome c)
LAVRAVLGIFCATGMAVGACGQLANAAEATAQHVAGAQSYVTHCASCHGTELKGKFGPPLSGVEFRRKWADRGSELLTYAKKTMPPSAPGSLDGDTYLAIVNYIQKVTGLSVDSKSYSTNDEPGAGLYLRATANEDQQASVAIARRTALMNKMRPADDASLANPSDEDWPVWRRTYDALGYSALAEINRSNVGKLKLAWSLSLKSGTNEIEPLVYQGVLFVHSAGVVEAIEASTGDIIWEYDRPLSRVGVVPLSQPRNLALYGASLFVPTGDNHIISLDMRTGKVNWDHELVPASEQFQLTAGPLAVHGEIIQGVAGCSGVGTPGGCFIVALDAISGLELWKFNTIPRAGEPGGNSWNGAPISQRFGASVWIAGSYDPALNLVYFGTGQTYYSKPLLSPMREPGPANAALYTDSTLALNPVTGKLVWYFQHFERDVWDLDWAFERSLIRLPGKGTSGKVVATIGKLGILDVLDAATGRYRFSVDLGFQNLVSGIDARSGRKMVSPAMQPRPNEPQTICPYAGGGRNWPATAYDPASHIMYVPTVEACMNFTWDPSANEDNGFAPIPPPNADGNFGRLTAVDLIAKRILWIRRQRAPQSSAILATGGGIIFEGTRDRVFRALDNTTGDTLWMTRLENVPNSFPITFKADGKQFVAVTTGGGTLNAAWRPFTPEIHEPSP